MRRAQQHPYPPQAPYGAYGQEEPPYQEYGEEPGYQEEYGEEPGYQEEYGEEPGYQEEYAEEPQYGEAPYWEEPGPGEAESPGPEIVSTSQAVNLTCTLAALSGLFALFLYMADRRSQAVRRISVQSIALLGGYVCASLALWILGTLFGIIPILGFLIGVIFWLLFIALSVAAVFLKVRMMLHAYRGYAYQLPLVGEHLRRFE